MDNEYYAGKGCKCSAYASFECCCDVDWTEPEIYELKEKIAKLEMVVNIIKDNKDEFLWEPCDCGCPSKSTARSKAAVELIRLLKALEDS